MSSEAPGPSNKIIFSNPITGAGDQHPVIDLSRASGDGLLMAIRGFETGEHDISLMRAFFTALHKVKAFKDREFTLEAKEINGAMLTGTVPESANNFLEELDDYFGDPALTDEFLGQLTKELIDDGDHDLGWFTLDITDTLGTGNYSVFQFSTEFATSIESGE